MNEQIKRIDTPYGRVYMLKVGDEINIYPSVTTVLASEPSPWLEKLSNDIGAEQLAIISAKAAGRGTVMHTYSENYLICMGYRGKSDECLLYTQKKTAKDLAGKFDVTQIEIGRDLFYNLLDSELFVKMKKPLFAEKFLWSNKFLFAGTADFGYVEDTEDGDILGDFKSAKTVRGEEQISKYKKQLGAYSIAYEERTGRRVKRAEIWISHPNGVQPVILEKEELEAAKESFKALCETYHRNWNKTEIVMYLKGLKETKITTDGSEGRSNTG